MPAGTRGPALRPRTGRVTNPGVDGIVGPLFPKQKSVMIKEEFLQLLQYKDLLINLVFRDLTVRYKRSVLGFCWTMVNPLINTIVFTVVFSAIFRFAVKDFIIYFLSAYQLWMLFSQSTILSSRCILFNGQLLKKVYLPKTIFVFSIMVSELVNFSFAMLPLLALVIIIGKGLSLSLLFLPIPLLIMIIFTLGVSFILAAVTVFFHDIMDIYQLLLMPWMYLTPIFYPLEIIPAKYIGFLKINPMYYIIDCFRAPIYMGHLPDPLHVLWAGLSAAVVFIAGIVLFNKLSDDFIYYI
jgi:ABC-2 type transport system permease protein